MEQGTKSWVVGAAGCSHDLQHDVLFIGRKECIFVETEKSQVMAASNSLSILDFERKHVFVFEEELCDTGIATA